MAQLVPSYDVATFRELSRPRFTADKSGIYFQDRLLEGSCSSDFRELSQHLTVSNGRVFFFDNKIEGADANSFRIVAQRFYPEIGFGIEYSFSITRDKNHIFLERQKMTELDAETFVVICANQRDGAIVRDKNGTFQIRRWPFRLAPVEVDFDSVPRSPVVIR